MIVYSKSRYHKLHVNVSTIDASNVSPYLYYSLCFVFDNAIITSPCSITSNYIKYKYTV